MGLFQNCVRQPHPPFKMAAVAKNRNFFNCPQVKMSSNFNCSYMARSSLTYIPFLAHLTFRPCELLPSLFVSRPSVNISHFNLLLRKHWANGNQTLVECSLGGPPSKCVRWSRLPTKMAAKLKIEKRGDEIKKKSSPLKLLSQSQPIFAEMILGWSPSKFVSSISDLRPRWPPQPNLI